MNHNDSLRKARRLVDQVRLFKTADEAEMYAAGFLAGAEDMARNATLDEIERRLDHMDFLSAEEYGDGLGRIIADMRAGK